ncbi:hypothetical protein HEK616_70940 [Streptomyces nigrescens]|uniref:Secreted protein n=2 Tax=Streptomyces TaxID=1883 RepID=A0ABN6R593_STRNI|nr:hypothetical protein [Streptomyces nigrescens]MEE4423764.1 hypothetical protein [Streptomyces sp. DSM 41528]BDM73607.1 hypothetical protein HEK616_70940 [Streptomyces nigrescens]
MQTLLTVVVLLALIALGALFLARLNAQQIGRMSTHRYADWKQSMRQRIRRRPRDASHQGPLAGPPPPTPPPSGKTGGDL